MSIQEYLNKMKDMQNVILQLIESDISFDMKKQDIIALIENHKIRENKNELKSFLHLLLKISNNHHRISNFFDKIFAILNLLKDEIQKYFSNSEIFTIVKSNKKIILFLIESKVITIDKYTSSYLKKDKNSIYFLPEIKEYLNQNKYQEFSKLITEDFEKNRQIGENDSYVCKLIRDDSIEEFESFVKKTNFSLTSKIKLSTFETNPLLLINEPTLIEYSVFYGSIHIFKYLEKNNVELTPSLLIYSIHSQNIELIQLLFDNDKIELKDNFHIECFKEALRCHHNNIAKYIQNKFSIQNFESQSFDVLLVCLEYYNFEYIQDSSINKSVFYYLCKFDYCTLVDVLLKTEDIDIDLKVI